MSFENRAQKQIQMANMDPIYIYIYVHLPLRLIYNTKLSYIVIHCIHIFVQLQDVCFVNYCLKTAKFSGICSLSMEELTPTGTVVAMAGSG